MKYKFSLILSIVVLFFICSVGHVIAQTTTVYMPGPITGWLWSTNVGWISLSSSNPGQSGSVTYGVTQLNDGSWTGNAWSDTLGWLQFGGAPQGCDTASTGTLYQSCVAKMVGMELYGYAHFVNGGSTPGWDGWMSFNSKNDHNLSATVTATAPTPYALTSGGPIGTTNTMQLSGQAWEGDSVVGWLAATSIVAPAPCSGATCSALTLSASPNPVTPPYTTTLTIGAVTPSNFNGGNPVSASWTTSLSSITCPSATTPTTSLTNVPVTGPSQTFTLVCNDINGNPITASTTVTTLAPAVTLTSSNDISSCPVVVPSTTLSWTSNINDSASTWCTAPYTGATAPAYNKPANGNLAISTAGTYTIKCRDSQTAGAQTTTSTVTVTDLHPTPCAQSLQMSVAPSGGSVCPSGSNNPQAGYTFPQTFSTTLTNYSSLSNVSCNLYDGSVGVAFVPTTATFNQQVNNAGVATITCNDSATGVYQTANYTVSMLQTSDPQCYSGGTTTGTSSGNGTTSSGTTGGSTAGTTTGSGTTTGGTSGTTGGTTTGGGSSGGGTSGGGNAPALTIVPPTNEYICPVNSPNPNAPHAPRTLTYDAYNMSGGVCRVVNGGGSVVSTQTLSGVSVHKTVSISSSGTYTVKCFDAGNTSSQPDVTGTYTVSSLNQTDPQCIVPVCSDGIDNDGDGLIDSADPGCHIGGTLSGMYDPLGQSEVQLYACNDGFDNDGDGKIDSLDPGCYTNGVYTPSDNNETDPPNPVCSDNKDNDGDGLIDSADPGCHVGRNLSNPYDPLWNSEYDKLISGTVKPTVKEK